MHLSCEIWKERNQRTFDGVISLTVQVLLLIRPEGEAWITMGSPRCRGAALVPRLGRLGAQLVLLVSTPLCSPFEPVTFVCVFVVVGFGTSPSLTASHVTNSIFSKSNTGISAFSGKKNNIS